MTIIHIKRVGAIDAAIGFRLRQIRQSLNLSQRDVAERLGLTAQQIQKYEQGTNRLSAARLLAIAIALNVTPNDLLGIKIAHRGMEVAPFPHTSLDFRAVLLWQRLTSVRQKRIILDMLQMMADHSTTAGI